MLTIANRCKGNVAAELDIPCDFDDCVDAFCFAQQHRVLSDGVSSRCDSSIELRYILDGSGLAYTSFVVGGFCGIDVAIGDCDEPHPRHIPRKLQGDSVAHEAGANHAHSNVLVLRDQLFESSVDDNHSAYPPSFCPSLK